MFAHTHTARRIRESNCMRLPPPEKWVCVMVDFGRTCFGNTKIEFIAAAVLDLRVYLCLCVWM